MFINTTLKTMNDKPKTLEECKDEVAIKYNFSDWKDYLNRSIRIIGSSEDITDEAAKLYAGQTKQLEKYSAIEKAVEIASKNVTSPKVVREGIVTPISEQSQQPVSIQWLSEEDMDRISHQTAPNQNGLPRINVFKFGMDYAQRELRKRVIDPVLYNQWVIDNYSRAIGGLGSGKFFKKYISGTDEDDPVYDEYYTGEELLQIYINSKTK